MIAKNLNSVENIVLNDEICGPSTMIRKKCGSRGESMDLLHHSIKHENSTEFDDEIRRASPVSVTAVLNREHIFKKIGQIPYCEVDCGLATKSATSNHHDCIAKKKVRFLLGEDGNIDEELSLYSFPDFKLTPKMIQECWYSKEDRLRSKFQIHQFCREHETSFPDYQEYHDAMSTAISFLDLCEDDHEDSTYLTDEVLQAMTFLASGETRGMERSMQFHMSLPRISTKTNVHAVLRTQTLLRELGSEKYDTNEVEELIADQCMINSLLGVRWAKMIAQGDAIESWLHLASP
jgi:hypothetical protein